MEIISEPLSQKDKAVFFDLVQKEWDEDFSGIETIYNPIIFVGKEDDHIVGGLAVFHHKTPDDTTFKKQSQYYKDQHIPYIGYFVIDQNLRGKGYGIKLMNTFLEQRKGSHFWIVIENLALQPFYEKLGFHFIERVDNEVVMCTKEI